jgi:hypothetical protein
MPDFSGGTLRIRERNADWTFTSNYRNHNELVTHWIRSRELSDFNHLDHPHQLTSVRHLADFRNILFIIRGIELGSQDGMHIKRRLIQLTYPFPITIVLKHYEGKYL